VRFMRRFNASWVNGSKMLILLGLALVIVRSRAQENPDCTKSCGYGSTVNTYNHVQQ
jgi:hypothetical protein